MRDTDRSPPDDALPWDASPEEGFPAAQQAKELRARLGYLLGDVDAFENSAEPFDFFDHARSELAQLLEMAKALERDVR